VRPGRDLLDQYPTAADGVIAAMTGWSERGRTRSALSGRAAVTLVGDSAEHGDVIMDSWLVERARAGDVDAYRVLVHRHRDRMYRIATVARRSR
jgi:hypothetical protein